MEQLYFFKKLLVFFYNEFLRDLTNIRSFITENLGRNRKQTIAFHI